MTQKARMRGIKKMNLDSLRDEINQIDSDIIRLLGERATVAAQLGKLKKKDGLPIQDAGREAEVVERAILMNEGPLDDPSITAIYREIIDGCTKTQEQE